MGDEIYRLTLRLNKNNPQHQKVLNVLEHIPKGKRSREIFEMILQHAHQKDMEEIITAAVQQAIKNTGYTPKETEEVNADILGFLNSLQQEDT